MATMNNQFKTPARRLHFIYAYGCLAIVVVMLLLPFLVPIDETGMILGLMFVGVLLSKSAWHFFRAFRTPSRKQVMPMGELVKRLPTSSQIVYYRRVLWISGIAFPLMAALLAFDLHRLETGEVNRVSIWIPIVPIYQYLGYWPSVLSPLVFGVICGGALALKIRKLSGSEGVPDR